MTPDRWHAIEQVFHAALTRPLDERPAFLAQACGDDRALREEVESLLAHSAAPLQLLDGEADPSRPRYVVTEPWVGYRFAADDA